MIILRGEHIVLWLDAAGMHERTILDKNSLCKRIIVFLVMSQGGIT